MEPKRTAVSLTDKQQVQEGGYKLPYHWFIDPATSKGRLYFGYWNAAIGSLPQKAKTGRVADAGCGDGRVLGLLRDRGYQDLTGIDYSERALAAAKEVVPGIKTVMADLKSIPLPEGSFDGIVCIETIEHIPPDELPAVTSELARVLVPGGTLVITVPALAGGPPQPGSAHYQHFTVKSLSGYLPDSLEVASVKGQDPIGFHPLKLFYVLIDNKLWDIRPLRRWYNLRVWPRVLNLCEAEKGRRLIMVCKKYSV
jgi:SAM-dependent methyltransferase